MDLVTLEGQETDLTYFNTVEAGLTTLESKYAIVPDAATKEGMELIRLGLAEMRPLRVAVDKRRKETGVHLRQKLKEINTIGNGIIDRIKAVEGPYKQAKQDEEEAEAKKEAQRIAVLQTEMQKIKARYDETEDAPSTIIANVIEDLTNQIIPESFNEFQEAATELKDNILIKLQARFERTVENEKYANEQRAEAERLKEERAQLKVEEDARQAEAAKERARIAALEAEAKAKIAEMEQKAKEEWVKAKLVREQEKTAALARETELQAALDKMKTETAAYKAKQDAELQARIDKEKALKLEAVRILEKEAEAKAEAERREAKAIEEAERLEAEAIEEAKRVEAEAIAKATRVRADAKIAGVLKKEAALALQNTAGMSELMANTTINYIQSGRIPHIIWVD